MVMAGDFQELPKMYLVAIMARENQKFPVHKTAKLKAGIAMRLPIMQIHDFIIGLPWPNLSHTYPPTSPEKTLQKTSMSE